MFCRVYVCAVLLLAIGACSAEEPEHVAGQALSQKVAILPQSEARRALFPCSRKSPIGVTSASPPTVTEVLSAESQLSGYLHRRLNQSLEDYYRQYSSIIVDGKRVLLVHAFQPASVPIEEAAPDWRTRYVFVCDAGKRSWGVEYLIEEKKFRNFEISSEFPPR